MHSKREGLGPNKLFKWVSKIQVISASPTRSGTSIQVRVRYPVPNDWKKTRLRCVSFRVSNMSHREDWDSLQQNRQNEVIVTIYYCLKISYIVGSMNELGPSLPHPYLVDSCKDSKEFQALSKKIYNEAHKVYKKGTFKRVEVNHKIQRAKNLMKQNLLWALREGLDAKEIRVLLNEACAQQLIEG